MQKEQFFQHAMKDTWAAANRMAATDRVRYKTSQYHDHRVVPGVFDRLLEELVYAFACVASHKKRLPTRFASSAVISSTITIFMRPLMTSQRA